MKYSRKEKRNGIKMFVPCHSTTTVGTFHVLSFVLLDVNSCHAFLIRNVIRSDAAMMMSFPWDLQTFHSLPVEMIFLYCMLSLHPYKL